MKKKGLREATQLYHVSSSPVHDTVVETNASTSNSPVPTPAGLTHSSLPSGLQDDRSRDHFCVAPSFELPTQAARTTPDRLSPRVELVLGPPVSAHASGGSSNWRERTADWVEMVERSTFAGGGRGGGDAAATGSTFHKNPNFRRTSSFTDAKLQQTSSAQSRQFRERSMTQVTCPPLIHF